MTLRLSFSCP